MSQSKHEVELRGYNHKCVSTKADFKKHETEERAEQVRPHTLRSAGGSWVRVHEYRLQHRNCIQAGIEFHVIS